MIQIAFRNTLLAALCVAALATNAFATDAAPKRAAKPDAAKKPAHAQVDTKTLPDDKKVNADVDAGFSRWSAGWMMDRYLPGSVQTTERGLKDGIYVVRGMFSFARSGTKLTIPFAAAYTQANAHYTLSRLCYNDNTSGMTDCIDPNGSLDAQRAAAMQSSQVLGSIVALGVIAAISEDNSEVCVKRYTIFGEPYFECE